LSVKGIEIGFIEKPNDTPDDKNAWRCFFGIEDKAEFIGHQWSEARMFWIHAPYNYRIDLFQVVSENLCMLESSPSVEKAEAKARVQLPGLAPLL